MRWLHMNQLKQQLERFAASEASGCYSSEAEAGTAAAGKDLDEQDVARAERAGPHPLMQQEGNLSTVAAGRCCYARKGLERRWESPHCFCHVAPRIFHIADSEASAAASVAAAEIRLNAKSAQIAIVKKGGIPNSAENAVEQRYSGVQAVADWEDML